MKKAIASLLFLLTCIFLSPSIRAQFVTPIYAISGSVEVITLEGETLKGELRNAGFGPNGIMSFKVIEESGEGRKFKADEVKQLKIKVDGLAKMEIIAEQSSNIEKLAHSNFEEVLDRAFIYWQRVKHPTKDKYLLLQLLNPGFDHRLKVYDKPGSKSGETSVGGVAVSGNQSGAYYVIKNGETLLISKKKYQKQDYQLLFGDCEKMKIDKPNFKEFAAHVFIYESTCEFK